MLLLLFLLPFSTVALNIVHASVVGYNLYEDKSISYIFSILNLLFSLVGWITYDYSQIQKQFVKGAVKLREKRFQFGIDGLSIFFVILSAMILPIAILSN